MYLIRILEAWMKVQANRIDYDKKLKKSFKWFVILKDRLLRKHCYLFFAKVSALTVKDLAISKDFSSIHGISSNNVRVK